MIHLIGSLKQEDLSWCAALASVEQVSGEELGLAVYFSCFVTGYLKPMACHLPLVKIAVGQRSPCVNWQKFINFFAALGLRCCTRAFSSCSEQGLLFIAVHGLLIVVASHVAEQGLQVRWLQQLRHVGSVVVACGLQSSGSVAVAHGLNCSTTRGIFPDQGSNPRPPALAGGFLSTVPPGKPSWVLRIPQKGQCYMTIFNLHQEIILALYCLT